MILECLVCLVPDPFLSRMEGQQELLEDSVFQASNAEAIVDDYVKSPIQDVECLR